MSIINYNKTKLINIEILENNWNEDNIEKHQLYCPFQIKELQQYNPIYSLFFELNHTNYNSISLNHKYYIQDLKTIVDLKTGNIINKNVFVKFSPILDPIRYMIGKYENIDKIQLPQIYSENTEIIENENPTIINSKINSVHNASYVDSFFYYLSSILLNNYNFCNGIDFYGSFLGIQEKFKINIEEDIEYLENSSYFRSNINKLFVLENWNKNNTVSKYQTSCSNRQKINIKSESVLSSLNADEECKIQDKLLLDIIPIEDCLETPTTSSNISNCIIELYAKKTNENSDEYSNSEISYSTIDELTNEETISENDEDKQVDDDTIWEDDEDEDEDNEDDEEINKEENDEYEENSYNTDNETQAYINKFPIQLICMEKCDGTLDQLFMDDIIDENIGISALLQIIMTIITYQTVFDFTHNDLHTNNITYVNTNQTHIYYKYNNNIYCVPTYGRIYKLIDFGRAIYKFQKNILCSDSFSSDGDANTQYNFSVFYDPRKPVLLPNKSFDLCRLGSSIYDFLFEEKKINIKQMDKFQKIIYEWCLDDKGKNILYKINGDERYPGFKLYKAIARNVTKHTPQNQLLKPIFKAFVIKNIPTNIKIIDIDSIPILM